MAACKFSARSKGSNLCFRNTGFKVCPCQASVPGIMRPTPDHQRADHSLDPSGAATSWKYCFFITTIAPCPSASKWQKYSPRLRGTGAKWLEQCWRREIGSGNHASRWVLGLRLQSRGRAPSLPTGGFAGGIAEYGLLPNPCQHMPTVLATSMQVCKKCV